VWVEANLAAGRAGLDNGDFRGAYDSFLDALSYPENLDVGPPSRGPGSPKIFYHLGRARELLGERSEAAGLYERAAGFPNGLSEQSFYGGRALSKLGRAAEAAKVFEALFLTARERLAGAPAMDFFEKFGERRSAMVRRAHWHFLAGLGLLGLEKGTEAAEEFAKTLALDPNHLEARRFAKREGGGS
jgi:tetratricopeptide (TPR) repeat protein